jgi:hypothetical protein
MESEALARAVIAKLREAGHQAYLVGGSVRDLLLGAKPKDFDVSTDARPERIMELFPQSGQVGAHFGVVLVRDAGAQVEVATFRSDHEYADGRRPASVHFESDPREDVLRRDFTINGLMMEAATGEVLDYVGGRADLERRVVRAIGDPDARFREDHLRLLRAVRFAARLGFEIESATFEAMARHHALILKVAAERVREELTRILTEGGARRGFELLDASGMLADLLPEVAAMKGVGQPPEFHPEGDVWTHTLLLLEGLRPPHSDAGMGRAAARRGQAAHLPRGGAHPLRRPRGGRRQAGARHPDPAALFARRHGAGGGAGRQPHALQRRAPHEAEHAQALFAHAGFRRAPGAAPPGLPGEQRRLENYELVRRKLEELPEEQLKPAPLVTGTRT